MAKVLIEIDDEVYALIKKNPERKANIVQTFAGAIGDAILNGTNPFSTTISNLKTSLGIKD